MSIPDPLYLAQNADLVQTVWGAIFLVTPSGELRKLDFWADACDQRAQLSAVAHLVTAWRDNGMNGGTFGRWHNITKE